MTLPPFDVDPTVKLPVFLEGFKRDDLARLFAERGYRRGAEIGVAEGRYAAVLCEAIPDLQLICVDPWRPYAENGRGRDVARQDTAFATTQERLKSYDVTYMREMSASAAERIPLASLDFVYIDGNHKLDYVREDLYLWSARVRSGGMVSGHDYYDFRNAGVVEAVDEFTARHRIRPWFLTDSRRLRPAAGGDYYRESSFFWIKP